MTKGSQETAHSGNGPYSLGWWFCSVRSLNEPISAFFARYARSVPPLRGGFPVSLLAMLAQSRKRVPSFEISCSTLYSSR
jgi:hypothetical protein